jgi:hypothetical protein
VQRTCSCSEGKTNKKRNASGAVCKLSLIGHIDNVYDIVFLSDGIICSVSGGVTLQLRNIERSA